ncbi:MAG TPA: DUF885 domain-containing protein [Cyclobacteriaceae bacterium]|nr:DUF885 domain-containing protein [Cyclobacteriaceae bacterium]
MLHIRRSLSFVLVFIIIFSFLSCTVSEKEERDISKELNAWFDARYEEMLQRSPMQLTSLGRKDLYDQIDDMSLEAEEAELAWFEASVNELQENFKYSELNADDKISYDLWIYQYNQAKESLQYKNLSYIFSQMRGMHTRLPQFLINFHRVDSLEDMTAYINRIKESGRAINQLVERAKEQTEADIRPPKFAFEVLIKQTNALTEGVPFSDSDKQSPLWADALSKIASLKERDDLDPDMEKLLQEGTRKALIENYKPAYDNLLAWLEAELPKAEEKPTGVSRHPNGEDFYNFMLRVSTTTNLTADEIHQIGLSEVARIQKEMLEIKDKVGFKGDLKAFFKFVNTDPQFFFPNTDEGRQAYLDESKMYLDELTKKLPQYFGILPKADLIVKRVEAFREQDGAPQHYNPGTIDGSRPGVYYAHLSDMKAMPKSTMEGVAYHEGNPGHHMQISIAQELESVPKFRTQSRYTAYVEGWALYSEILAKEMGGYQNPYYDFGRLVNEIWRAIRLVVDTGLHSKGWTEEDGIRYFSENSSIAPGAIKAEVQRYMVVPGQATAYKIGMLKIQELRAKAENELGAKFDIREFHDTILDGGAMPLEILERKVDNWIASKKNAA